MKKNTVIFIPDMLTTCNDYINAERTNKFKGAEIKKIETERVRLACVGVLPIERYPVQISFIWLCKNKRVDPDNIAFAKKFILDGLQKAGVLKNDGWDFVCGGFSDRFSISPAGHVGVNVLIYEDEKG